MAGAQFHLMVKSEADVDIHIKETGSQDPFNFQILFSRLLSFIYWRTWQFMKGLQSLVMKKSHLYVDKVHEVVWNCLNTWNHLCVC